MTQKKEMIESGQTFLGIEFGSTRIKAVLIDGAGTPLASGSHEWENRYENGVWTYHEDEIWSGLAACYRDLAEDVKKKYNTALHTVGAIGFSAMMHGYLPLDKSGKLLTPFRTWRNTITGEASEKLTGLFAYPIPQRWSIAHLYQAILNGEEHVKEIDYLTTLAGYVHLKLTGCRCVGVGEASGMFPIDPATGDYDAGMMKKFDETVSDRQFPWKLADILPEVRTAGAPAGVLTEEGAKLLDPTGVLAPGIPLCPPEGDAGTGMAATNSVRVRTGNVSAGTSCFSMVVLEKPLARVHSEIDLVTTPDGKPVAMVHCNNCTNEINAWVSVLDEFARAIGREINRGDLFTLFYEKAAEGEKDCGGLLSYNFLSGEPVAGVNEGRPLFVRRPDSRFTLANFLRLQLYSSLAALKLGMDILLEEENVPIDSILGHGGLFKTPKIGQSILAGALNVPVSVMETAGEGGAWGMALLAAYMANREENETLPDYLDHKIFASQQASTLDPDPADVAGFRQFLVSYRAGLPAEKLAGEII